MHLSPLSLAEKCRIGFGAAVLFILFIALLIPYAWMNQLTRKALLDAGKAKSDMLQNRHFQTKIVGETALPPLSSSGAAVDANSQDIIWIRFTKEMGSTGLPRKESEKQVPHLSAEQRKMIESLRAGQGTDDGILLDKKNDALQSCYVRVFRASDRCISCHNPQGSAGAFGRNEPIGAVVIQSGDIGGEIGKTILMNLIWTIVAVLIGGAGAIVTFYVITQRVILRPIRQLRAIANNIAEGNLDIRSSIDTRDEYEKLSDAFNHMLDGLQAAQEKLRQANKQLDAKIAELSERNIELFRANKIKSEFLANISHEFRTPLNAIMGFAQILREKPETLKKEKGRRYAENIITSGQRLLNMINDLLDLAKTEAGKMKLHIEEASLPELCRAAAMSFAPLTKKNKLKIHVSADDNIPPLTTDAGKVQQILNNFLSNAVKFTPAFGKIEIKASMLDEKMVRIAVSDNGCGIAEADREKIFEKFRQADGSITRQSAGSGLGLAISKELAAMLAGSIGLESELGKGSVFWLDIPVAIAKEQSAGGG